MNGPNEFLEGLLKSATDNGWIVVEYLAKSPGFITLQDSSGTEVMIRSPYGLDLPHYVGQFVARERTPAIEVP